ncbi:HNH endonuclease [Serratia nevei]|uniref:HNH endonuclease n=1 Tax=Serratia nevei TaxID=2703794 RepID=UPI00254DE1F5|nr:HNH endonuclease [Serratia nevei]MDK5165546.1 HNH endonuclease [Serratia nevei]
MDRKEREEIRKKVETKEFLRETFDYDESGFLVWKEDRGNKTKAGMKAGFFHARTRSENIFLEGVTFKARRLIWVFHRGIVPENFVVTTKTANRSDIRIWNLELRPQKTGVPKDKSLERDPEKLRSLFSYDPVTGVLAWKTKFSRKINVGDVVSPIEVMIYGVSFLTYRICFVVHHGRPIREGFVIDHYNGNHLDNRIENIREVTPAQNSMNCRVHASKKSGLPKGVVFGHGLFRARIFINKRLQHLGYFDTPEEASAAYQAAAKEHFGEYACFDR